MVNKIDKILARLTKKNKEKTQQTKSEMKKGEVTTYITGIQKTMREYYEQLYAIKFDNLEEMDNFLEIYSLPKLNQYEIDQLNRPIARNEIEYVIKNTPNKYKSRTRWLHRRILPNIQRGSYTQPP